MHLAMDILALAADRSLLVAGPLHYRSLTSHSDQHYPPVNPTTPGEIDAPLLLAFCSCIVCDLSRLQRGKGVQTSFNQPEGGDGEPTLYVPSSQPLSKRCARGKAAGPGSPPHLPQVHIHFPAWAAKAAHRRWHAGPSSETNGAGRRAP